MVQITIEDLFEGVQRGEINTSPDYQREAVWNPTNQQNIIDSIINDFYIPPLLFAVHCETDAEEPDKEITVMNVVDGKQRLTSIVKFMSGTISYLHRTTNTRYWWVAPEGKKVRLVPELWRKQFLSKAMYCVQWQDLEDNLEREIFKRVQYGMQLSPAEKMHAINSVWANLVRMLCKQYVSEGLSQQIRWTRSRGQDFQFVAQILFLIYKTTKFQFPTAPTLDKWLRYEDPPSNDFKREADKLFRDYLTIAQDKKLNYGFHDISDRIAPVEVVMIGYLLFKARESTWETRSLMIDRLRRATRQEFTDIRSNTRVIKFMQDYVDNVLQAGGTPKKKRKRDDEEAEYRPGGRGD